MRKTIIFGALAAVIGLATVAQASNGERVAAPGTGQVTHERAGEHGKRDRHHYAERQHKRDMSDTRDFDGDGSRDSRQHGGDRD
jgi:hypothetical protein